MSLIGAYFSPGLIGQWASSLFFCKQRRFAFLDLRCSVDLFYKVKAFVQRGINDLKPLVLFDLAFPFAEDDILWLAFLALTEPEPAVRGRVGGVAALFILHY